MGLMSAISSFFGKPSQPRQEKQELIQEKIRRQKKKVPRIFKAHRSVVEWSSMMEKLQEHPLTQAKVINEQLMATILQHLEQIHGKIDQVHVRLDRLEARQVPASEISTKASEGSEIRFSRAEKKILELVKQKKNVQAEPVARLLRISRSNASLKLNKLYSVGLLEKHQDGKDVFYRMKG